MVFADGVSTPVKLSGVIGVSTNDLYFSMVYVYDANDYVVAKDVVASGIKMVLEFNAENSARAEVVDALRLTALPLNELEGMYALIDDHELFPKLVAAYRQAPGIRDEGKVVRLGIQIAHSLEMKKSIQ